MRFATVAAAALTLVSFTAPAALAQERIYREDGVYVGADVSLGLGLGDPTSLDAKFWTGNYSGLNIGLGLERFDDVFGVYGEYEFGIAAFSLNNTGARGAFYVGLGGALGLRDSGSSVALVIPIGLDFRFSPPIDLFIEARPGIGLVNRPSFGIGGQLGVRFRI